MTGCLIYYVLAVCGSACLGHSLIMDVALAVRCPMGHNNMGAAGIEAVVQINQWKRLHGWLPLMHGSCTTDVFAWQGSCQWYGTSTKGHKRPSVSAKRAVSWTVLGTVYDLGGLIHPPLTSLYTAAVVAAVGALSLTCSTCCSCSPSLSKHWVTSCYTAAGALC